MRRMDQDVEVTQTSVFNSAAANLIMHACGIFLTMTHNTCHQDTQCTEHSALNSNYQLQPQEASQNLEQLLER